eukprot:CAMPEP_0119108454 /NCGR_PEP_ID=MMETSP1180-20130426/14478_1 /TAXON_ID=3052 ORGANISM="Chlamydomonas cf sp, Strain CCMP681" /NCGR_SAMPLE_ID=MMETSP1180 /ASSEMBLY_ACC=CAM_ASM_000741 /LENGTH=234 /DNA_ID=CAMNT_0007094067 /DNA_START=48 /DNA_END=752 /DNA_ORIENTATION=+
MGNTYLLLYNTALTAAWGYVLYLTYANILENKGDTKGVYQAVELPLKIAQSAAILEVLHAAMGLVRSPVAITAMQVASRLWVLWGLIVPVPGPTTQGALVLGTIMDRYTFRLDLVSLLTAWCISEVIRYSFYAFKEALGYVPYPSLWLRYTGFIVLYPLGVASELTMCYLAWPTISSKGLFSLPMPNRLNLGVDYSIVCLLICASYLPGLPTLYQYMLVQRRKQLGGPVKAKAE